MTQRLLREIAIAMIVIQILAGISLRSDQAKAQTQRSLQILDNATGLNQINLGNESQPIPQGGYPFTVKIVLNGATTGVAVYQVAVTFDNNSLRCTNILIPESDPSYIFNGKQEITVTDFSDETQNAEHGGFEYAPYVLAAGALVYPDQAVTITDTALICVMNFTAKRTGNFTLSFYRDNALLVDALTYLQDQNNNPLPATGENYTTVGLTVSVFGATSNPVAAFTTSPSNPRANQTVTFDPSSSYDPSGGTLQTYKWDFGDNTSSTQSAPVPLNHTYSQNGAYLVNLTVINTDNLVGSTVQQLMVGSIPTPIFTISPIGAILPNEQVTFNASDSFAPNSTVVSYIWDFGDQSNVTTNSTVATHSYSTRGVYNVNLTVEDSEGLLNSTTTEIQVGKPPSATFENTPEAPNILVGDDVTFTATATSDTGVSIVGYVWDFGEVAGPQNGTALMIHSFPVSDNYTVSLTVFDSGGLHSSYNKTIEINIIRPAQLPDYTVQITLIIILVLVVLALVIRRSRRKKEEILEI